MIVEYLRYRVPAAQVQALVDAYVVAAESLRRSPHCHGYDLTQCTETREAFILRILWDFKEGHLKNFAPASSSRPSRRHPAVRHEHRGDAALRAHRGAVGARGGTDMNDTKQAYGRVPLSDAQRKRWIALLLDCRAPT